MIPIIMTVVYLIGTTLLGIWMAKNNKDLKSFATANGSVGVLGICCMCYTTSIGPGFTVGAVQNIFNVGLAGLILMFGQIIGYIIFALPHVKMWRIMAINGSVTFAEQVELLYGQKMGKLFAIVIMCICYGGCAIGPYAMAAIISPMTGLPKLPITIVLIALLCIVVAMGGIKGAATTSLMHAFFLFFGTGLTGFICLARFGGIGGVTSGIPVEKLNLFARGGWTTFITMLPMALAQLYNTWNSGSALSGKNGKTVRCGFTLTVILLLYNIFVLAVIGFAALKTLPADTDSASAIYYMAASCGPVVSGFLSVGVIAAIYSSLIPQYVQLSTMATRSFFVPLIKPDASEELQFKFSKIFSVVSCCVVSALGIFVTSFIDFLGKINAFAAPIAVVWLVGLIWRRINENSAFISAIAGAAVSLFFTLFPSFSPLGQPAILWGIVVTLVVLVPTTMNNKEKISAGWHAYAKLKEDYYLTDPNGEML